MQLKHHDKELIANLITKLAAARNMVAEVRSSIYLDGRAVDKVSIAIAGLQDTLIETLTTGETPDEKKIKACHKCNGNGDTHHTDCPNRPLFDPQPSIQRRFIGQPKPD